MDEFHWWNRVYWRANHSRSNPGHLILALEMLPLHNYTPRYRTLIITTFVITAKFVRASIMSAQKLADRVFFHCYSNVILQENIRFVYLLESPRRGDSNKYTKRMIHKRTVQKYPYFML